MTPLPGRFVLGAGFFAFWSFDPEAVRDEFVRVIFWTPDVCVVAFVDALAFAVGFFTSLVSPFSVFVTLLTSPRAARFLCVPAVDMLEAAFFVWSGFFVAPASAPERAAAFALVRRVVGPFSSFSFVTPRERTPRA